MTAFEPVVGGLLPVGGGHVGRGVALDELLLAAPGVAEGGLGEAVEVAQAAGGLVERRDRVGVKRSRSPPPATRGR